MDPITEIEAEVEAELPDLDVEAVHLPHIPHRGAERNAVAPDTIGTGPPPNLRADRQRFLVAYLRVALVVAFVIGVLELALPEDLRDEAATVMVAVFVAGSPRPDRLADDPVGAARRLALRRGRRRPAVGGGGRLPGPLTADA